MKLEGFGIFVDDMATMVRFYRDVLGFEIKEDENTTNVFLEKDGTLFLLFRKSDFEKMTSQKFAYCKGVNGHFEIALGVANYAEVDKVYAKVTAAGAKGIMAPTTEPWGQRTCYIADPEGNLVEIGSFVKENYPEDADAADAHHAGKRRRQGFAHSRKRARKYVQEDVDGQEPHHHVHADGCDFDDRSVNSFPSTP